MVYMIRHGSTQTLLKWCKNFLFSEMNESGNIKYCHQKFFSIWSSTKSLEIKLRISLCLIWNIRQDISYPDDSVYFFCFLIWSCCCDLKIVTWASGKLNFAIANLYRSATHTAILNIFVGCIITTWWLMGLYSKGKLIFNDLYLETS